MTKRRVAWNKGKKASPETCAKISRIQKGRKRPPETCAKISKGLTGRPVSAETRGKISKAQKGKTLSPDHLAKLRAAHARPWSAERRAAHSEKMKGRIPWNKGKRGLFSHTAESRRKISENNKGKHYGRARHDQFERGWIYAIASLRGGVKVGFTTNLDARANNYRNKGFRSWLLPGEFKGYSWTQEVSHPYDCEQEILGKLGFPPNEITARPLHEVIGVAFDVMKSRVRRD